MKKAIGTAVTAGVVLFGSVFVSDTVHAETLQGVKEERSDVRENLSEAESKVADVMLEMGDLNEKVNSVNDALDKNERKMNDTKQNITKTKDEAEKIEKEITNIEKKVEERKAILKERIVSLQKNGGDISYLEVVFGSKSFGDMISRVSAVSKIADSDEKLMRQQEEDKSELQKKKDVKQEKLSELKDMKIELEGMKQTIIAQKKQNEQDRKQLKKKEKHLKGMKADLEDKDASLGSIEQEINQQHSNNDPDDSKSNHSGDGSNATAAHPPVKLNHASGSSSSSDNDDGDIKQLGKTVSSGSGSYSSAIQAGYSQTGTPYVTAGRGPGGFDCSGFVSWAYGQAGVSIPSSTAAMQGVGSKISYSSAQPGDLVFFNTYKTNGHVGIYLGNGKFLGAQNSTGVAVADMTSGYWKNKFAGHVRRIQ
ncbi:peptidase P60 [Lentibacillus kapialis]|uniref:Peptidase P60 n=1 Tax=Lentibacillus kapialis TaxID=340214 RepID=A0A917PST4_9BACI|nr:C40 family peptidase [Lentibacillus kapialis]GGJ90232.1 peptidase P60 [Lentibacillus kapialis]